MKKFLFSAVALIGFTVASYGANTAEVEVNENLLVLETQVTVVTPCDDCYHNYSIAFFALVDAGTSVDDTIDYLQASHDKCVAKNCN